MEPMDILTFVSANNENKVIAFVALVVIACTICYCCCLLLSAVTVWIRGYPPAHCDAYGDPHSRNCDDDAADDPST